MKMMLTVSIMLAAMATNVLAESAREYAPGQVKKKHVAESAREFAPGQLKKRMSGASVTPQSAPQPIFSMPLAPIPAPTQ